MNPRKWIELLGDEDIAFIKRFILASGSLKELAIDYGITYPTVRLRLDRLIEKVRVLDSQEVKSDFERLMKSYYAEGVVSMPVVKALLDAHRKELEEKK